MISPGGTWLRSTNPSYFLGRGILSPQCLLLPAPPFTPQFPALYLWSWPLLPLAAATAKSVQSCLTLCDPMDGSPRGSPVPGILQTRTLEWVSRSFSNAWKWKVKGKLLSRVQLFATPWTAAYQAPPSMGVPRQEYWSGSPLPSPFFPLVTPKYHESLYELY